MLADMLLPATAERRFASTIFWVPLLFPILVAIAAGIQINDIITKVSDQVIDADHPLSSVLVKNRPGDKVKLTLIRSGKEMTVDVTLGQPPQ